MSCKKIKLTHSSKSNMIKDKKRLREKKSAVDIRWFEVTVKYSAALNVIIEVVVID